MEEYRLVLWGRERHAVLSQRELVGRGIPILDSIGIRPCPQAHIEIVPDLAPGQDTARPLQLVASGWCESDCDSEGSQTDGSERRAPPAHTDPSLKSKHGP